MMHDSPVSINHLLDTLQSSSRSGRALVKEAYNFAELAHEGQKRYSGEPYFNHVYHTALNLAEIGMGPKTVTAGLLHDVLEDANVDVDELEDAFGDEIAFLVSGVTKLGKIRYSGVKRHVESLRKLFVATSQDIRVIIIKLADRLHNMRTLKYVPEHKQERIARETLEVYAPVAERLGIGQFKRELQDLSFAYTDPETYKKVHDMAKHRLKKARHNLEKMNKKLLRLLKEEGIDYQSVHYREKGIYSLYKKLKRKDMNIDRVFDILALRIIVPKIKDCYQTLGVIHSVWKPYLGRVKDYIASPKPNGYKSLHTTIFVGNGSIAEIQIRTPRMHEEAEFGIASHAIYKDKGLRMQTYEWLNYLLPKSPFDIDDEKKLETPQWIKNLGDIQNDTVATQEFLDNLTSDFFSERIFVFTPNGDVIDLPKGSTPIDFAYMIHSEIGNHMSGAKINSKLASLDTTLRNGDIVEIVTKNSASPSSKWLNYAKTAEAKRKIRSHISAGQDN